MMKLVFALVLVILIADIFLYRAYHRLPLTELKRRARAGASAEKKLSKVADFGPVLDVFLWLVGLACLSYLMIAAARWAWWLAVIFIVIFGWVIFWAPKPKDSGWAWRLAAWFSQYFFNFISWAHPAFKPLADILPAGSGEIHTGLYDKDDLLDLLNVQNHQIDNRVPEEELKMAFGALTFGDKKVSEIMRPRRDAHFVLADEIVGPTLMDELHKTKQTRFPVVKQIKKNIEPEVMGTLLLADIIGLDKEGPVSGVMKKGVYFINEQDDLRTCLDAFIKTRAHLLIVVNNFEEITGVIALEDILAEIVAKPLEIDFVDYNDKQAVAGRSSLKD